MSEVKVAAQTKTENLKCFHCDPVYSFLFNQSLDLGKNKPELYRCFKFCKSIIIYNKMF